MIVRVRLTADNLRKRLDMIIGYVSLEVGNPYHLTNWTNRNLRTRRLGDENDACGRSIA
jgi:hypothetical protein